MSAEIIQAIVNNQRKINTMKNIFKILVISLIVGFFTALSLTSMAQPSAPPPPASHGQSGNQAGGPAPVGSGLIILLGMGAAYGTKKLFNARKRLEE
jgi:polyferredoxin